MLPEGFARGKVIISSFGERCSSGGEHCEESRRGKGVCNGPCRRRCNCERSKEEQAKDRLLGRRGGGEGSLQICCT